MSGVTMLRFLLLLLVALLPCVAFAAGDGHGDGGVPWMGLFWHAVNLSILVGVIVWLARRPVSDALKNRSVSVRREIESAQQERAAARSELEELEHKLADFELQVERLRKEMAEQAQHEREVIMQRAQREAEAVRIAAQRAIRDESLRARRELREQTVALAVQLAEGILAAQVGDEDQQALAQQLLQAVDRDHAAIEGN